MKIEKSLLDRVKEKQKDLDNERLEKYKQTLVVLEHKGLGERLFKFKDQMLKCIELVDYCDTQGITINSHLDGKASIDYFHNKPLGYNYGRNTSNTYVATFEVEVPTLYEPKKEPINITNGALQELDIGIISKEDTFLRFTYGFRDIKALIKNIDQFPTTIEMSPAEARKCIDEGLDWKRINEHISKLEQIFDIADEYEKFITEQLEKWLGDEYKDKETIKDSEIDEIEK